MRIKPGIFASLGAAALLALSAGSGVAVDPPAGPTTDVDIVVTSTGTLSVTVVETDAFNDVTYSFDTVTSNGELTITVTDARGTAVGWSFNLRGTTFTGTVSGPGDTFPITALALEHASTTALAGNTNVSGVHGYDITSVAEAGQQVASADEDFGNGIYALTYDGELTVPGDTLVDTYTTTITVEIPSGPEGPQEP